MKKLKNKWINGLIPALLLHICMGVIYCWSLIKTDVAYALQCSTNDIEIAFSLSLLCLGLTASFVGRFVDYDVKLATGLSGIFFVTGMIGSILAIHFVIPWLFILSYGVLQGIGLGIGYITPLKNLMMWFDKHKGYVIGLTLCMFGVSKIIFGPLISNMVDMYDIIYAMSFVTVIGFIGILISKFLIDEPEGFGDDFKVISWKDVKNKVWNKEFGSIWLMVFLFTVCGVSMVSYERLMMSIVGVNNLTMWIFLVASCNVLGRFCAPVISMNLKDKANVYIYGAFVCILISVITLISLQPWTLLLMLCVASFCFGGSISSMPVLLQDRYGYKQLSMFIGIILSAWAIGGFVGDMFADYLFRLLGDRGTIELIRKFFIFYMISFLVIFNGVIKK